MSEIKVNPKYKQIKLINVLLGQAFLGLFSAVFQFNNPILEIFHLHQLLTVIFVLTTFFLLIQINHLAQQEAAAQAYQAKLEQNRQLVQIFVAQNQDFLQDLDNLQILITHGNSEMVNAYLTQVSREYENLLEIVKLGVPPYTAAIIKKVHQAEAHFINLRFNVETNLKEFPVSLDDFEKGLDCLQAIWSKHIHQIPLEKRNIELFIDIQGPVYLIKIIYCYSVNQSDPEVEEALATIKAMALKYRAGLDIIPEGEERTVFSISVPKNHSRRKTKEQGPQDNRNCLVSVKRT